MAKIILGKPKNDIVVKTIYGFKLRIDPIIDNGVERSIYYYGTYEKGTLDIIGKILQKGDVFVDVGANIGLMSIYASGIVGDQGRVISFEPNPETRRILENNIALNDIQNIKVEGYALSNENKQSRIYERWDVNRGGASLIEPSSPKKSYDIHEIVFSEYFDIHDIIKLIKIDVEGFELNVLRGAREFIKASKYPPALIVEFSSNRDNTFGSDTYPLYSFLNELKTYRFFKAIHGKERISKLIEIRDRVSIPKHDNVFCFTEEHLNNLPKNIFRED
ncbi:MAG: FkbM family methyltransferase [Bacteroidia bacterium]|nr:FkbM family methyltransferase [Bacteroidia bacterium]